MTVVSIRDFRSNQSKYLDLAARKKEFLARVDEAHKSIAKGKGTSVSSKENLDSLFANL